MLYMPFYILEVLDTRELIPTIHKNQHKRIYPQIKMLNYRAEWLTTPSRHVAKPRLPLKGPGSEFDV